LIFDHACALVSIPPHSVVSHAHENRGLNAYFGATDTCDPTSMCRDQKSPPAKPTPAPSSKLEPCWCSGHNRFGQVGNGENGDDAYEPVLVEG
jgi:hypothetical protein